jgi:hypothetical protein
MARTPLELVVERDELSLVDLADLAASFAGLLASLDIAGSHSGRPTLDLRLATVSYHSPLMLRAGLDPREDFADNGPAVATLAIRGIEWMGAGRGRPEGYPDEALENLRRLAGYTTNGKAASVVIRAPTLQLAAPVTPALAGYVDRALTQGDAIGAIEGSLDTVSVHAQPYFTLYDALSGRGVRCYFREGWRARVVGALGKRMIVHGRLRRDPSGAPREMRDIDQMEELGRPEGSPDGLAGVFAGLDVQAYLRELRG